jgi:hypothetical protein
MHNECQRKRQSVLAAGGLILPAVILATTSSAFGAVGAQAKAPEKQEMVFGHMDPALSLLKQTQGELQNRNGQHGRPPPSEAGFTEQMRHKLQTPDYDPQT